MPLTRFEPSEYLEWEFAALRAASEDPNQAVSREQVELVLGAVDALEAIVSIGAAEARSWRERIGALSVTAEDPGLKLRRFRGDELLRVIPVHTPGAGEAFELQAVELYRDGVGLRWVFRPSQQLRPPSPGEPPPAERSLAPEPILSDDLGTRYLRAGGGASGSPLRGESLFVPAVPSQASRLFVQEAGHRLDVPL